MILTSLLSFALVAQAEQNTELSYSVFRLGRPPAWNEGQTSEGLGRLSATQAKLTDLFAIEAQGESCARFAKILKKSGDQFGQSVRAAVWDPSSEARLLNRSRARVAASATGYLAALFAGHGESGFDPDTRQLRPDCFRDRKPTEDAFSAYLQSLGELRDGALGQPGFDGLGQDENELLRLADHEEIRLGRRKIGVNLIALGASMVFWEFFPPLALIGARAISAGAPEIIANPWIMTPLRGAGILADSTNFVYSEKVFAADAIKARVNITGGSEENLLAIEKFLGSPLNSPALYFGYDNQSRAQWAVDSRDWLNAHHLELGLGNEWLAVVNETTEAQTLPGAPLRLKIGEIHDRLQRDYNVEAHCKQGWFTGATLPECLLGMRRLLLTFQRGLVAPFSPLTRNVLGFEVGGELNVGQAEDTVQISFAGSLEVEALATQIVGVLRSDALVLRLDMRRAYLRASLRLQDVLGRAPEFDESLSVTERQRVADRLTEILTAHPEYRANRADVFFIGRRNSALFEKRFLSAEEVSVRSTDAELQKMLASPRPALALRRQEDLRQSIRDLAEELSAQHGINARCSVAAELTLSDCESTLHRLRDYLRALHAVAINLAQVQIVAMTEMDRSVRPADNGKDEITLRTDFFPGQIREFVAAHGWIGSRTSP